MLSRWEDPQDLCQPGCNDAALHDACLGVHPSALFQHSGRQPLPDEAQLLIQPWPPTPLVAPKAFIGLFKGENVGKMLVRL